MTKLKNTELALTKDELTAIATHFAKVIEQFANKYAYGIRTDYNDYAIGEELPLSHDLTDEGNNEELDGTSTTGIGYLWCDGEQEDIDEIIKAIRTNIEYSYSIGANNIYLIGGIGSEYGNDPSELVIQNAIRLA